MEKKSIYPLNMSKVTNDELFTQQGLLGERLDADEFVKEKLGANYISWKTSFSVLDGSNNKVRRSTITAKIVESNKKAMGVYNGIYDLLRTNSKNIDTNIANSAKEIISIFDNKEKIYKMPLNIQLATFTNCLQDLKGKFVNDVIKVGAEKWVEQLESANNEFRTLYNLRIDEKAINNNINMTLARKNIIEAYKNICLIINSLVLMEGDEKYADFIDKVNAINEKFGTKKSSDKTEGNTTKTPTDDNNDDEDIEETPTGNNNDEEVVEETHEEKMANARAFSQINEGEWKNGDYCWHLLNSVKTYWKLLDETQKTVKPYLSGGEAVWEKVS